MSLWRYVPVLYYATCLVGTSKTCYFSRFHTTVVNSGLHAAIFTADKKVVSFEFGGVTGHV